MTAGSVEQLPGAITRAGRWLGAACDRLARYRWGALILLALIPALSGAGGGSEDLAFFIRAAHRLFSPHWGSVFAFPSLQSGPLQLLVYGGVDYLARLIHVKPQDVYAVVMQLTVTIGAPSLVSRFRLDGTLARRRYQLLTGLLIAYIGLVTNAWWWGHSAEILIPLLWVIAANSLARGRPGLAGVLIGISSGIETWGILGVTLLAGVDRWRDGLRTALTTGLACVVLYGPFVVLGRFGMFRMRWEVVPGTLVAMISGRWFPWDLRLFQAGAAVCVGALVLRYSSRPLLKWLDALLTVLLVRMLFDPLMFNYYWLPVVMLGALATVASVRRTPRWGLYPFLLTTTCLASVSGLPAETGLTACAAALTLLVGLYRPGKKRLATRDDPVPALVGADRKPSGGA